jgi:hypothetical protein
MVGGTGGAAGCADSGRLRGGDDADDCGETEDECDCEDVDLLHRDTSCGRLQR